MASASIELIVPKLGESITEAVIARWLKQVGEPVALDEPVAELETDKVTVNLPAPAAGVLSAQRHPTGATVLIGDSIGTIAVGATSSAGASVVKPVEPVEKLPAVASAAPASAAPAQGTIAVAARVAEPVPAPAPASNGSSIATHDSSGRPLSPAQRRALLEHEGQPAAPSAPPSILRAPAPAAAEAPIVARPDEEVVAMTPLRRTIASRLVEAQHTAAILTTFNEIDMSAAMALRARYQDEFVKKHGIKLGFMSFFARASVESLKEFPGVNAELRGSSIIYKKHYDLGIAVGGGKGLVVPVVRGVDRLSFAELEKKVADLGARAKDNKLTLDELSGGTFSITNGGIYGSMMSTPLLNMPQTGILGMHNIIRRPIAVGSGADERIEIRPMMYVALSYDHRVVDGREAVQFLVAVKQRVEAPDRLLFSI